MNKIKKLIFYAVNIIIGIISFYAYLYFWVLFSWGKPFQLNSLEALISLALGAVLFLGINYFLLKNETAARNYWWIGLGIAFLTILIIITVVEFF
ncbi:hypothetical protein [Virgibacillus litoralis]|uniref:Uncharacterized protein n=1 Tax=Virgibacillus litoralis TaxID=578221 RepID=A0ABS4HIS2_9BACI|nr:hypothetical protein [Virgibacillus litoralis]MBP1950815.1 hypothetical protein [Virgibacillus litoralis]